MLENYKMNKEIITVLIDRYIKIVSCIGDPQESYKYDAITKFQENWNIDNPDFLDMFKKSFSKVGNLLQPNSWEFIYKLAEIFPNETRNMFVNLYNDNNDLEERVREFQKDSDILLTNLKQKINYNDVDAQQDESTISVYLSLNYPEKYCFYNYFYYNELKTEFNLQSFTENGFVNLQNSLPQFQEMILERDDLIKLYRSLYPKPRWDDTILIIQNILSVSYRSDLKGIYNGILRNFTRENLLFYFFNLDDFIEGFNIKEGSQKFVFNVSDKQLNFTIGQKYVWCLKSDGNDGCFKVIANGSFGHYSDKFNSATNSYLNHFKDHRELNIHRKEIDDAIINVLEKTVKSGYYKFNDPFIERMAFDKDFRSKVLDVHLTTEINTKTNYWIFQGNPNYYDVVGALKNTSITSWKVASHKDKIKIGDKFILRVTGSESGVYSLGEITSEVGKIITDEKELTFYKTQFNPNEDRVEVKITHNFVDNPILLKNIQDNSVLESLKVGNQGTNFSATKEQYEELMRLSQIKKTTMNYPLNQILFGCPGSGKTYTTKKLAVEIIEDRRFGNTKEEREEILRLYDHYLKLKQIRFTTFHQSLGYEDFIEGIKPKTIEKTVVYEVEDGIFTQIASKAQDNWLNSKSDKKNTILFEDALVKLKDEWEENISMKFPLKTKGSDFTILSFNEKNIRFTKSSGGTGHTLSFKTMKELFYGEREHTNQGVGLYYPPIIEKLTSYSADTNTSKKLDRFVLIMDEINRGNISSIFGELITLIEDDKRLGCDESIEVVLPYSKENFGVPPNLYLIGTMNTADRSVEALDTALRRRFSFVEMKADPEVLIQGHVNKGLITGTNINLIDLLKSINERIELLIDKDHQIGHSYFIGVNSLPELKYVFQNKIIPLLEEYFYGDFGKIGLVLGDEFVKTNSIQDNKKTLAKFSGYDDIEFLAEKKIYTFCDIDSMNEYVFISIYKEASALLNNVF